MFTIVLIFASGFKLLLPVPDMVAYNDQKSCESLAVNAAKYVNGNITDNDKVITVQCLRNA